MTAQVMQRTFEAIIEHREGRIVGAARALRRGLARQRRGRSAVLRGIRAGQPFASSSELRAGSSCATKHHDRHVGDSLGSAAS